MVLNSAAIWLNTVFYGIDESLALLIHKLAVTAGGFFTPFFEFVSFFGKEGIMLILISLALIFFKRTRKIGTAMLLGLAIGALITNCCLKILIARPRPYADTDSVFYQLWLTVGQNVESDKSFPSGHTTAAFASMTALFLAGNRKYSWSAFIFAILMGIARIYLVVHYASDVFGGIIVGIFGGFAGYKISAYLPSKFYDMDIIKRKKGKHEC